jgi:RNA polymerase sigma-70 factor (ECF subfamily)
VDQAPAWRSLVDLARSGDVDAFESLVRTRMDAMYRLSLAILGNESDAADAAQETFVAVWRRLPQLRDADRFDAWLGRVAVNSCRMILRTRGRRRVRELPLADMDAIDEHAVGSADTATPDAAILKAAIRRLSPDHRTVLALHHLEDRPVAEVAEILGIPVGTAKSRLFSARAALDRALRQEEGR